MDFAVPDDIVEFIERLDDFIEREIKPMEQENDNIRFLDHRREDARTDWDRGGLPNKEWEDLMREARRKADAAGLYRYSYPKRLGGMDGTNLGMAVIREHLATKGLGLHCDLQTEHTVVGNILGVMLMEQYGSDEQKAYWLPADDRARWRLLVRHHRAEPRQRRHVDGDERLRATATSGSSTATRRGTRACTTPPTT